MDIFEIKVQCEEAFEEAFAPTPEIIAELNDMAMADNEPEVGWVIGYREKNWMGFYNEPQWLGPTHWVHDRAKAHCFTHINDAVEQVIQIARIEFHVDSHDIFMEAF